MTAKEIVIERTRELPDDATLEDIVEELQILAAIRQGQADVEAGRVVSHEQACQRMESWFTK
jgi:predicted transcriptional regulator